MTFALDIERFAQKTDQRLDLIVRKVALEIFSRVVQMTPVDTGRARANWGVGVNTMPTGTTDATEDPTPDIESAVAAARAGDTIYLVNNLPYIGMLEYGGYPEGPRTVGGFSAQAPQGMVRVTLVSFPGIVNQSAAEAKSERP